MSLHDEAVRHLGVLFMTTTLLGTAVACSGRATGPTPTPGPGTTAPVTISPAVLQASVSDPVRPDGRFEIMPSVTFSAAGSATMVKDVNFAFVVDADRGREPFWYTPVTSAEGRSRNSSR